MNPAFDGCNNFGVFSVKLRGQPDSGSKQESLGRGRCEPGLVVNKCSKASCSGWRQTGFAALNMLRKPNSTLLGNVNDLLRHSWGKPNPTISAGWHTHRSFGLFVGRTK